MEKRKEGGNRPPGRENSPGAWFDRAFGAHYLDLYAHRNPDAAKREVAFAVRALGLRPGHRVLDLGSGPGYHLSALRQAGLDALGIDRSRDLTRASPEEGACVLGDLRRVPFGEVFDGVLSFFTVLGYFDDEEENRSVFREIGRVLRPDGRFLLDHLNAALVRNKLVPESERVVGGRSVRETRWIEEDPPRVKKRVEVSVGGEDRQVYTESVRLFGEAEFRAELGAAGLSVESLFGDFDGGGFTANSPRLILTGRK